MTVSGEARMLIDGELVDAASGATYANINPATEEEIGQVADGGADDMERAISAARRAFDTTDWASDPELRTRGLRQLQEALANERETLRPQIVAEVGAPLMLTYAVQQDSCIDDMAWDIDCIDRIEWEYDLPVHEFFGMTSARRVVREPIGVVAAITPWNFPFMLNLSKIVPALAAGNTVVLKPAPDTPWSATHIGKMVAEHTDIPAGVFNIVTSADAANVGEMLTADERVDMVSFTGSTAVGKRIMARGSETLKRVFLELGGKSANIVLDDADLEAQAGMGAMVCMHSGQGCAITTRMLLHARATTKASSCSRVRSRTGSTATRVTPRTFKARSSTHANASACSATSIRRRLMVRASSLVAVARHTSRRGSTSSRRSSWMWIRIPRSRRKRSSVRCSRSFRMTRMTTPCALPITRSTDCPER